MKSKLFSKITILSFLISFAFVGCKESKEEKEQVKIVRPVKVYEVGNSETLSSKKMFTGVVRESREVKLAFQIAGPIDHIYVREGQYVRKGQLVASMSTRDYAIQLSAASAYYENVKVQAERYAALYAKKSTSKSVLDKSQTALVVAKAKKEAAANSLRGTKLYAPFNGYIQRKFAEDKEKVRSAFPILSIIDLKDLKLEVLLSEKDFVKYKSFSTIECSFESLNNKKFTASIIDIEHKANFNKLYKMNLKLDTKDNTNIVPGMLANVCVNLSIDESEAMTSVPVEAVFSYENKSCVWVVNNKTSKIERRFVLSESFTSKGMMKIRKGISKGDIVVIAGVYSVREGEKVKLLPNNTNTNVGGQL